jgi:hypothetical protein
MSLPFPDTKQRVPKDAIPEEVRIRIEPVLRFYARASNYEDEMQGEAFIPDSNSVAEDNGAKARAALKWLRGQS